MTPNELRLAVEVALGTVTVLAVPFAGWVVRAIKQMNENQTKITQDLAKVTQSLYGVTGTNGISSQLMRISEQVGENTKSLVKIQRVST